MNFENTEDVEHNGIANVRKVVADSGFYETDYSYGHGDKLGLTTPKLFTGPVTRPVTIKLRLQ